MGQGFDDLIKMLGMDSGDNYQGDWLPQDATADDIYGYDDLEALIEAMDDGQPIDKNDITVDGELDDIIVDDELVETLHDEGLLDDEDLEELLESIDDDAGLVNIDDGFVDMEEGLLQSDNDGVTIMMPQNDENGVLGWTEPADEDEAYSMEYFDLSKYFDEGGFPGFDDGRTIIVDDYDNYTGIPPSGVYEVIEENSYSSDASDSSYAISQMFSKINQAITAEVKTQDVDIVVSAVPTDVGYNNQKQRFGGYSAFQRFGHELPLPKSVIVLFGVLFIIGICLILALAQRAICGSSDQDDSVAQHNPDQAGAPVKNQKGGFFAVNIR